MSVEGEITVGIVVTIVVLIVIVLIVLNLPAILGVLGFASVMAVEHACTDASKKSVPDSFREGCSLGIPLCILELVALVVIGWVVGDLQAETAVQAGFMKTVHRFFFAISTILSLVALSSLKIKYAVGLFGCVNAFFAIIYVLFIRM